MKCGYCKHFGLWDENGTITGFKCKAQNLKMDCDTANQERNCAEYVEELEFKTKEDVADFVFDRKCSGCEYAHRIPGTYLDEPGDPEDCGSCADIPEFWNDYDKLSLEELIKKYTLGNDQLMAYYWCGNFADLFRSWKK